MHCTTIFWKKKQHAWPKKKTKRKNRLPAGKDKGHPHIIHAPVYPGLEGYGRVG